VEQPETIIPPEFFMGFECDLLRFEGAWTKKNKLPDFSKIFDFSSFADFYMGWTELGLHFRADVFQSTVSVSFPRIEEGDSVEVFIDTKNLKSVRTTHAFCHHFYFLPESVEGVAGQEITHFRTEERHPLCTPSDLQCKAHRLPDRYELEFFIPSNCLFGYEPEVGKTLGFCYRINSKEAESQYFGLSNRTPHIELYPYLWPTLRLSE